MLYVTRSCIELLLIVMSLVRKLLFFKTLGKPDIEKFNYHKICFLKMLH